MFESGKNIQQTMFTIILSAIMNPQSKGEATVHKSELCFKLECLFSKTCILMQWDKINWLLKWKEQMKIKSLDFSVRLCFSVSHLPV